MRNLQLYVSALALAGLSSVTLAAQSPAPDPAPAEAAPASLQTAVLQQDPTADKTKPKSNARFVPVESTADAPEITNAKLRPVEGTLELKIDSKTAKAGDAVTLRTTEDAFASDGEVIPKGSKVVGRVVEATPAEKDTDNSKITVQFEKVELKDGGTLGIQSVLQSVAPASGADTAGGVAGSGHSASLSAAGAAPRGTAERHVGGSAVVEEAPSGTAASHVTPARNAMTGGAPARVGTVVAQQGSVAIKTTAIPGVFLGTEANGEPFSNASGVILGSRQDVHLDSGTLMVLAVADEGMQEPAKKLVPSSRPKAVRRSKPAK